MKLECVNIAAHLVILLKMMVNNVVQMKYNFDPSDHPRLHQMAPLSIEISKIFWGMPPEPPTGSHSMGPQHPDRLHLQNGQLLQIFLRMLHLHQTGIKQRKIAHTRLAITAHWLPVRQGI